MAALACSTDPGLAFDQAPLDPTSPGVGVVPVDRFSPEAGTLRVRSDANSLPAAAEPIDFDALFLFQGLGPDGQHILYYDLDVHSQLPAKLYTFSKDGEALTAQLPVLAYVPGEAGYNDFVRVYDVSVPPGYRENSIRSEADLLQSRFLVTPTDRIINHPVVPQSSSAQKRFRGADAGLVYSWYGGQLAPALVFESEVPSQSIGFDERAVNISEIYVPFSGNPDQQGGGPAPASGMQPDSQQTIAQVWGASTSRHNVVDTIPGDALYSPLWMMILYDNAAFDTVVDEKTAEDAPVVAGVTSPLIDCPIVEVDGR